MPRYSAILPLMLIILLIFTAGCAAAVVQDRPVVAADMGKPAIAAATQHTSAAMSADAAGDGDSGDAEALSDFLSTEEAGQNAIWRDFKRKASQIGLENDGIILHEFGVAYDDILMLTFLSGEPIEEGALPSITIDAPLPASSLEVEYCQQTEEGYLTVYSTVMDRKIPYLETHGTKSLLQIELLGRDYVFFYNWDWREPEFPADEAELAAWLAEAGNIGGAYLDDGEHALSPIPAAEETPFHITLEHVSMRKNHITAEGSIEVLSDIDDEYRIDVRLEANNEVFYDGDGTRKTRLGDLTDSLIISSKKDIYQIGWQWTMPFYYADMLSDHVFIRIGLTNLSTREELYYNFSYYLSD